MAKSSKTVSTSPKSIIRGRWISVSEIWFLPENDKSRGNVRLQNEEGRGRDQAGTATDLNFELTENLALRGWVESLSRLSLQEVSPEEGKKLAEARQAWFDTLPETEKIEAAKNIDFNSPVKFVGDDGFQRWKSILHLASNLWKIAGEEEKSNHSIKMVFADIYPPLDDETRIVGQVLRNTVAEKDGRVPLSVQEKYLIFFRLQAKLGKLKRTERAIETPEGQLVSPNELFGEYHAQLFLALWDLERETAGTYELLERFRLGCLEPRNQKALSFSQLRSANDVNNLRKRTKGEDVRVKERGGVVTLPAIPKGKLVSVIREEHTNREAMKYSKKDKQADKQSDNPLLRSIATAVLTGNKAEIQRIEKETMPFSILWNKLAARGWDKDAVRLLAEFYCDRHKKETKEPCTDKEVLDLK